MNSDPRFLVGLIGEGIGASLTPPMHEREAAILGFDYEYRIHDLLEMKGPIDYGVFLSDAVAAGYSALNVTHPCKQAVIPYLDEVSAAASELDAVNLVLIRDARLIGENTDWTGFSYAVQSGLAEASLRQVVQLGAGGAGAATSYAILKLGAESVTIADLDVDLARELARSHAKLFPEQRVDFATIGEGLDAALAIADGVIHATPTGMAHRPGVPFDVAKLSQSAWVAEVVYRPIQTELLRAATARGLRTLNGGLMAVGQAADSIRLITGTPPDIDRMRNHFDELLLHESLAASAPGSES